MNKTNVAIFASGSGTNMQTIADYLKEDHLINIKLVLTNNPHAKVIERASKYQIPVIIFNRDQFYTQKSLLSVLEDHQINFIVLAGFMWFVPSYLTNAYQGKIFNIHPALLPKYGGKGMYGMNVHEAVISGKENTSGITIHHVNNEYDQGDIIFQATCEVTPDDTPEKLAVKIHELEHRFYPKIIKETILKVLEQTKGSF